MKTNEGLTDRVARVVIAVMLLSLLIIGPVPGWGLIGAIGVLPLVTGLLGYCPTYTLVGIDTIGGIHRSRNPAAGADIPTQTQTTKAR